MTSWLTGLGILCVAATGCSQRSSERAPDPAKAGVPAQRAAADAGSAAPPPSGATPTAAALGEAPTLTIKDLQAKELGDFIDPARGVWASAGGEPIHVCGDELAGRQPEWTKVATEALAWASDPEFFFSGCKAEGPLLWCRFTHPMPDESNPAHFVSLAFAAPSGGKPFLAGILVGPKAQGRTLALGPTCGAPGR